MAPMFHQAFTDHNTKKLLAKFWDSLILGIFAALAIHEIAKGSGLLFRPWLWITRVIQESIILLALLIAVARPKFAPSVFSWSLSALFDARSRILHLHDGLLDRISSIAKMFVWWSALYLRGISHLVHLAALYHFAKPIFPPAFRYFAARSQYLAGLYDNWEPDVAPQPPQHHILHQGHGYPLSRLKAASYTTSQRVRTPSFPP